MHLPAIPRSVKIGDAAAFTGTTPRAIRHYHAIGLLPEPERGADNRRRYGYDDMVRLLWIRKMADAGIPLDDIRTAFADADGIEDSLARLEESLAAKAATIEGQQAAIHRLRETGSPLGLLSPLVADRLRHLPPGALRSSDLDALLVFERIVGPLGAAIAANRFLALAARPGLRAEEDRLAQAEAALDDTVSPDDPRIDVLAAQRSTHESALYSAIKEECLEEALDTLLEEHAETGDEEEDRAESAEEEEGEPAMSTMEAIGKMPYDFSPARIRYEERLAELMHSTDQSDDIPSQAG
ncbi:MerR family transcriptional regulator [Streptomyces luteoverticillatus]|uniref:MerR family transcriptional regulator n=1 Tax=Streptomyces luteoverticillatus TaxID=66425 RepID=A0A3Q9G0L0_STRLT|nr:MerR family transcriptional regulator [Streptomyces luteoverticillatus]AZQ74915.1 MerR family transcriptional regulator [Streptomyces luteoverticillatus]